MRLSRLRTRPDFLRVAAGRRKWVTPGLILQARRSDHPEDQCRVGFTASRKVGPAVARNRARRRLLAAVAEVMPRLGERGMDYVVIARAETVKRPYALILSDLETALTGIARRG